MHRIWDYKNAFRILKGGKISLVVSAFLTTASIVHAAPTGGNVTSGNATISQNGNVTNINQSSNKASINWQEFSIGKNETVNFNQPNSNSITLNKVIGTSNSLIQGAMNANGQVILVNPNGVVFSEGSNVNVGGLIATTKNITEQDFQNGNYVFEGDSTSSILNKGTINAKYVAMMGKEVVNEGKIVATMGRVELAGGDKFTLNLNGDSLLKLTIDEGTLNALVENKGLIKADGGVVYLTTQAVDSILDGMVNNTGVIEAQSLSANENGEIVLFAHGGTAEIGGTIDASAPNSGDGGFIETSGEVVNIKEDAKITTKSKIGKTGTWLIDPNDFTIASSGGNITGTQLSSDLGSNNIQIATATQGTSGGNGDIHVNDNVSWSSGNTLTLTAERNININSTLDATGGSGGKVVLNYGQGAVASGNSADYYISQGAKINLQDGQNFTTKLGSDGLAVDYTVVNDATSLQNIGNTLSGNFVLGSDITITPGMPMQSNWTPIGTMTPGFMGMWNENPFTGKFDGLGHKVENISVNGTGDNGNGLGMFGVTNGASIRNINLESVFISGDGNFTGGLIGKAVNTNIYNVLVRGTVGNMSFSNGAHIGGIVGYLSGSDGATPIFSTIANAGSNVYVTGNFNVGGVVGSAYMAHIDRVYAKLIIHANSQIDSGTASESGVGGIVGYMNGGVSQPSTLTDSYFIGQQVSGDNGLGIGGLIGYTHLNVAVKNSYSLTNLNPNSAINGVRGGIVGRSHTGLQILRSVYGNSMLPYATVGEGSFTGSAFSPSGNTLSSGDMLLKSSYLGINGVDTPWSISGGTSSENPPLLTWEYVGVPRASTTWYMPGSSNVELTYSLNALSGNYIYNGSEYSLSSLWSASDIFGSSYSSWVLGADYNFIYNSNSTTGFTNAGSYSNITIDILKSGFTEATSGNTVGSFTISPKTLTLSASKVYDGNANLSGSNITLGGLVGSETLTYTGATANSKNVADNATNYITAINLADGTNNGLASNYQLPTLDATNAPATITARGLIVNGAVASTKTYDGTTAATISGAMLVGQVLNDDITVNTGTFADANAGVNKTVTPILSGEDASNYVINMFLPIQGTISRKILTLNGSDDWLFAYDKDYDGLTSTEASILFGTGMASLSGLVGSETVEVTAAGEFANKNAGDNKDVTVSFTLANGINGGLASNYDLSDIIKQATIYKKYLTVTGNFTANDKVYDGTTDATFATNNLVLDGVAEGEEISLSGLGVEFTNANAGTAKTVSLTGGEISSTQTGDVSNYLFTLGENPPTTTATITKKALTLNGSDDWLFAYDKDYDGLTSTEASILFGTGMASLSGLVGSETLEVTAAGEFANKNAGDNKDVTVSFTLSNGTNGGLGSNYDLADIIKQASIYKKYLTVTGNFTANDKVYDGTTNATFATNNLVLDGVAEGEEISLSGLGVEFTNANAGTAKTVSLTGGEISSTQTGDVSNYLFTLGENPPTTTAEISKANIVYETTGGTKTYGESFTLPLPIFTGGTPTGTPTVKVYDAQNNDVTSHAIAGTLPAGTYIVKTLLTDTNYALAGSGNSDGTLVVEKANLTYTTTGGTKTYGQNFTLPNPTFIGGTPSGNATVKVYDAQNNDVTAQAIAGTLAVGTYTVKTVSLNDNNYGISSSGNVDGILTIIADNSGNNGNGGDFENPTPPIPNNEEEQEQKVNDIITNIVNNAVKPNLPVLSLNPIRTDVVNGFERRVNSTIVNNNTPNMTNENTLGTLNLGLNEIIRSVKPAVNEVVKENKLTIVGETGGESKIEVVELQDLVAQSGGGELRVALSPNSFVELVNGGVNLPDGVSQEFYVVEDKK
ncbi:beta strand repeat-containing protein [Arcobacter cloacae]|uniref:Filamentous haemagglutinin FhaB/tRNA nuclease CdiA-like TPS domain-containing protein n=1 Tax=Arcobacter cloacae TaxID=1054034 RepID=A0A4Q0ZG94_9BACT|nr:YDG domain-containing protein [Arcobacter cloacae]RXJ85439.1 hypothetical protein CRU90_02350 [Arcobacter cloacae]